MTDRPPSCDERFAPKLLFFCRRREDVSRNEYAERLLGDHVPLALRHHPTLRRYVVNLIEEVSPGSPELDSIGELWFDSLADFRDRLYDSPEGERIVTADVARFLGGAVAYVTTKHVQRPAPEPALLRSRTPGVKLVAAVVHARSLTHDAWVRGWLERHAPLVLAARGVAGYKTSVVEERLSPDGDAYDGIAELYFPSEREYASHVRLAREETKPIGADIRRTISRVAAWRVCEYVARR